MNALEVHDGTPRPPLMQRVAIIQVLPKGTYK